jgi:hypothetical protein
MFLNQHACKHIEEPFNHLSVDEWLRIGGYCVLSPELVTGLVLLGL